VGGEGVGGGDKQIVRVWGNFGGAARAACSYLINITPELPHTSRRNIITAASLYLPPPLRERGGPWIPNKTEVTRK
jgi:hypothetical protein